MNCYFCKNPLQLEERRDAAKHHLYDPCAHCKKEYDLLDVYTIIDGAGQLFNAQIYVGVNYKIITIPGRFPMSNCNYELGRKYQIRLHLQENYTNICETTGDNINQIMKVPGFPINPSNAKDKLKLYLLFS